MMCGVIYLDLFFCRFQGKGDKVIQTNILINVLFRKIRTGGISRLSLSLGSSFNNIETNI